MARLTFVMPTPPLELGVSWTGRSLLNWVVDNCDAEMKQALVAIRNGAGGDSFRQLFESKAADLNARVGARILGLDGEPMVARYTYINEAADLEVN